MAGPPVVASASVDVSDRSAQGATRFGRRRGWLVKRMLLAADLCGLLLAFILSGLLLPMSSRGSLAPAVEAAAFAASLPIWVLMAKLHGLYDHDEERTDHSTVDELVSVLQLVTTGTWLLFAVAWVTREAIPRPARLILFWAAAIVCVTALRGVARSLCRRHKSYVQRTVVLGAGKVGQLVAKKLLNHPEYGVEVIGFVDMEPRARRPGLEHLPILGKPDALPELVAEHGIERLVIAFSKDAHDDVLDLIRTLNDFRVQIDIVPRFFDVISTQVDLHSVEGLVLLGMRPFRLPDSSRLLKRTFDVVVAGAALVLLTPLFLAIALWIKLGSRGPVFFKQVRMGSAEKPFHILKFRTMVADAEETKHELAHLNVHATNGGDPRMFKILDDPRVTKVGQLLRRFSLDELPQLLNVLRGEMSLVGPRPLILDEYRHVTAWAKRRLDLKPGVTGPWQVLGRNEIPFEEMVHLDYRYVTGWSLLTDIKIALRTIPVVLRSSGAERRRLRLEVASQPSLYELGRVRSDDRPR